MFKLILGLGNKDIETIKKISLIYAQFGIDILDCAVNVLDDIKNHLKNNNIDLSKIKFCVSVAQEGDIHSKKAKINKNCKNCLKCAKFCSQNAIEIFENKPKINENKCVGCTKCAHICKNNAIEIYENNSFQNDIKQVINKKSEIDILEFHAATKKKKRILKDFEFICKGYSGNISLCLSRKYLGNEKIIKLIKKAKEIFNKYNPGFDFIIQADGQSVNNADDSYSSSLEAISFFNILKNENIKTIISGGINSKTIELLELFNLRPTGLALGTYARKIALKDPREAKDLTEKIKNFYEKNN